MIVVVEGGVLVAWADCMAVRNGQEGSPGPEIVVGEKLEARCVAVTR